MDIKLIFLGIFLLVLLYFLFRTFVQNQKPLDTTKKLDGTIYDYNTFRNPSSANYYIINWLYVSHINKTQTIYKIGQDATVIIEVSLNTDGSLVYKTNSLEIENVITNNFPLQKWTCLIVSVDGLKVIDTYLDGKLVKSQRGVDLINTTQTSQITEGTIEDSNEIKINTIERIPQIMDPYTAWDKYIQGIKTSENTMSNYGLSLRISKNDDIKASINFPQGGIQFGE
jgi:hypothetical protein